jgi:hypothetical protein
MFHIVKKNPVIDGAPHLAFKCTPPFETNANSVNVMPQGQQVDA